MKTRIHYPDFLARKLAENLEMRSAVDATIVDFDSWLKDSKLPFFPDYTDHGPDHLTEVLETAATLVGSSSQARKQVSSEDAAVLILAVLLHDAAMHLSEQGFRELISGDAAHNRIDGFDTVSWPDLWRDFLFSARRWDDRKLVEVLGEDESGAPIASVCDPLAHYDDLRLSDRKLIGEFIRLHHPRMAHEFAIFGVPGPSAEPIRPSSRFGQEKLDLAGLVARSHGLPIRACLDYLAARYHRREYQGVHAIFLMALLRLSDYLQIQPGRAPSVAPRYKRITSPLSRLEHNVHRAVKNATRSHDDPESIEVQAEPENVWTFLRLKEILQGIQEELDASWAVLGEVYGSDKRLSKLVLSIRRIRSNLDDLTLFGQRISYFPARVELDLAHAEILKLLVRPLYGDRPEIGIRELLQNAVDAVRELQDWRTRHPKIQDLSLIDQEGDVEIWFEPGPDSEICLIIQDRGIGMTAEIIRDYFLKVGASYRNSHLWQREFELSDEEDLPRSRVLRSGRFGIGMLAAFLLGGEIEVSTRHVSASRGITFRTKLEIGSIELRYDDTLKIGTTIKVLNPHPSLYLRNEAWDWYCFDTPKVLRYKGPKKKDLGQKINLPDSPDRLPVGWYRVNSPEFAAVYVGLSDADGEKQHLVCNGIRISDRGDHISPWFTVGQGEFRLATPATVVLDPDGKLPLDLRRATLNSSPPFVQEIERLACESILAGMLINTPKTPPLGSRLNYLLPRFYRSWEEMVSISPWLVTNEGVAIANAWIVNQLGVNSILVKFNEEIDVLHSSPCVLEGSFIYGEDEELEMLLGGILHPLEFKGVRLLVAAKYGKRILRMSRSGRLPSKLKLEWTNDTWSLIKTGDCPATLIHLDGLPAPVRRSSIWPVAVEWFPVHQQFEPEGIAIYWRDIIRQPVIPFNPYKRQGELAHAFEVLRPYFMEHEEQTGKSRTQFLFAT